MADAVTTGEVICYNSEVWLHSLAWFVQTISQGSCSTAPPLACKDTSDRWSTVARA